VGRPGLREPNTETSKPLELDVDIIDGERRERDSMPSLIRARLNGLAAGWLSG